MRLTHLPAYSPQRHGGRNERVATTCHWIGEELWPTSRRRWRRLFRRTRRDRRAAGPQRSGQDDQLSHDVRDDRTRLGSSDARWPRRHRLAHVSSRPRRRDGLSRPGIERLSQALGPEQSAGHDGNDRHRSQNPSGRGATNCSNNSASANSAAARRCHSRVANAAGWKSPAA